MSNLIRQLRSRANLARDTHPIDAEIDDRAANKIERLECSLAISRKKHELAIEVNKSLQARVDELEDAAMDDFNRIADMEEALTAAEQEVFDDV